MLNHPLASFGTPRDRKAVAGEIVRATCGCFFDVLTQESISIGASLRAPCDRHEDCYLGDNPWYIGHGNYDILDPLTTALLKETDAG